MSLHPSSLSSINIDSSKIIILCNPKHSKLTPSQKCFYLHFPFYSSNLQPDTTIHLYSMLSSIYSSKQNIPSLLRIITISLELIDQDDSKETRKQYYAMLIQLIDLMEQTNTNIILAFYFSKLAINYVEHFLSKNNEYLTKIKEIGNRIRMKLKQELNEIKSKQYDILNNDQSEFIIEDKEKFYKSIKELWNANISDINGDKLKEGECVYLVSKRWMVFYRNFLALLKEIENNPRDYKIFLQTFETNKLFEMLFQCRLENDFSTLVNSSFVGYMGPVNNYWLLNTKENYLYDNDETRSYENVYLNDMNIIEKEYIKITKEQWDMLIDNFNYIKEIKRIKHNDEIEIYFQKIRIIVLDDNITQNCMELLHEHIIQISQYDTFEHLLNKIERCVNYYYNTYKDNNNSFTFNINAYNVDIFYSNEPEYSAEILKLILAFSINEVNNFKFNCHYLNQISSLKSQLIGNLQFLQNIHYDIELTENNVNEDKGIIYPLLIIQTKKFIIPYNNESSMKICVLCNKEITNIQNIIICDKDYCNSSTYIYCSDQCLQNDKSHIHFHNILSTLTHKVTLHSLETLNLDSLLSNDSHHGLVGLDNLGNTCFLNSALQCLSNCEELTKLFLSNLYKPETNNNNRLGTHGEVVNAYHDLIQSLWNSNERSLSPSQFRGIFIQFAKQFSGYSQHDSQEVLTFMLDKLHEDLNKISHKPYFEIKVQEKNETDEQASNRFWKNYLLRENSIIVDLFHGQYKNKVLCPQCKKVSITYEPFVFLSLPIPSEKIIFKYKYFPLDFQARHEEYEIPIARVFSVDTLYSDITKHHKNKHFEIILFDFNKTIIKVLKQNEDLMTFIHNRNYEICVYQSQEHKENIYCYLTHYSIINSYFGLIPTERIDRLTVYPIAIAIDTNYKIETIYSKIYINIVQPIYSLSNIYKNKKEETSSLITSFSSIDINNEHLRGFRLHLISNNYNHNHRNPCCDFCGCNLGSNHSCLLLSRFTQNESFSYVKQCFCIKEYPLCVNVDIRNDFENNCHVLDNRNIHNESGVYHLGKSDIDLYDCLDLFCSEEKLESDNMWYCSSCKKHQEALKKMDIYKAPFYLIIQLKRFKRNQYHHSFSISYSGSNKNEKVITFPITNLNMNKYIIGKKNNSNYFYDLCAVSQHYGGVSFGHYTAACKNGGKWYCFNDSHVSEITNIDDIIDNGAYLLFYKLKR